MKSTQTKIKTSTPRKNNLEKAKIDFQKLMQQVEPFVIKSDFDLKSTEGKWFDTNANTFKEIELRAYSHYS